MIHIFTGGRYFCNPEFVTYVIDKMVDKQHDLVFVGDATGLDQIVRTYIPNAYVYRAQWNIFGKRAGPMRNEEMVLGAKQHAETIYDIVGHVFPGGKGTAHCARTMRKNGITCNFWDPATDTKRPVSVFTRATV